MKQYHKNPRRITNRQLEDLESWLSELGDLSGVVHDLNSDEIIGGNQRSKVFDINNCEIVLTDTYTEPDAQGTVAHGYVVWNGAKYAYRQVRLDERQCEMANIVANKAGGAWDLDVLAGNFQMDDLLSWGFEPFELGLSDGESNGDGSGGEKDEPYSREIKSPHYQITGEKPAVSELYDDSKTQALIRNIESSTDLTDEQKRFLTVAAQRHTVLHFNRIAEYYAHADAGLQDLMEESALVIIDFNKAIELGFVKLSEEIAKLYAEDYPDD